MPESNRQMVFGTSALENPACKVSSPFINYPGSCFDGSRGFSIDERTLAKHVLLLGGSGCGKTNVFFFTLEALFKLMTEDDIAIVFDTKGEFFDAFSRRDDYVIGNSARFRGLSYTWNIFDEILADGWSDLNVSMNAREIAAALFHGRGSSSQPFFCNAARDMFRGVLVHFVRSAQRNPDAWKDRLNTEDLIRALQGFTTDDYRTIFGRYDDLRGLITYIGRGDSNQALGVFGELNSMVSEYFVGVLSQHRPERSVSMRQAVRNKGGKALFVEYDLSVGETLSPMYRLLIDQALKEALSRTESAGKVYVVVDEFKLLPQLQHIDDALNFGRGLGVRVMAGIQSIDQLYEIYGEDKGAVIASGFGSMFAFHTNDGSSRDYITKRFGSNVMVYSYYDTFQNEMTSRERDGNTIEEWDQLKLGLGQAVVGLGYEVPFLFQFDKHEGA